jgi:hypothetical protein
LKNLVKFLFSYLSASLLAIALSITLNPAGIHLSTPDLLFSSPRLPLDLFIEYLEGSIESHNVIALVVFVFTFIAVFCLLLRLRKKGELGWDLPKKSRWKLW